MVAKKIQSLPTVIRLANGVGRFMICLMKIIRLMKIIGLAKIHLRRFALSEILEAIYLTEHAILKALCPAKFT